MQLKRCPQWNHSKVIQITYEVFHLHQLKWLLKHVMKLSWCARWISAWCSQVLVQQLVILGKPNSKQYPLTLTIFLPCCWAQIIVNIYFQPSKTQAECNLLSSRTPLQVQGLLHNLFLLWFSNEFHIPWKNSISWQIRLTCRYVCLMYAVFLLHNLHWLNALGGNLWPGPWEAPVD